MQSYFASGPGPCRPWSPKAKCFSPQAQVAEGEISFLFPFPYLGTGRKVTVTVVCPGVEVSRWMSPPMVVAVRRAM